MREREKERDRGRESGEGKTLRKREREADKVFLNTGFQLSHRPLNRRLFHGAMEKQITRRAAPSKALTPAAQEGICTSIHVGNGPVPPLSAELSKFPC